MEADLEEGVAVRDLPQPLGDLQAREYLAQFLLNTRPGVVEADPALLRRVFDNLLDNAAKYADHDTGDIEIGVAGDEAALTVQVRDRGTGVAPEDLPRLFEPFFRADRSRTRGTGGSGIGLAFCASVVRAHGGEIDARLRKGGGLTVEVRLPTVD